MDALLFEHIKLIILFTLVGGLVSLSCFGWSSEHEQAGNRGAHAR